MHVIKLTNNTNERVRFALKRTANETFRIGVLPSGTNEIKNAQTVQTLVLLERRQSKIQYNRDAVAQLQFDAPAQISEITITDFYAFLVTAKNRTYKALRLKKERQGNAK